MTSCFSTPRRERVVWPGTASDGAVPGRFFSAPELHRHLHGMRTAMREYHEEDPKRPHPVWSTKKPSNPAESSEAVPIRNEDDSERHRHVV
jgi:hypothetical protein